MRKERLFKRMVIVIGLLTLMYGVGVMLWLAANPP